MCLHVGVNTVGPTTLALVCFVHSQYVYFFNFGLLGKEMSRVN